ncbi:MAG: HEAT repeat domain-containing protein [Myxococcota bacterium]
MPAADAAPAMANPANPGMGARRMAAAPRETGSLESRSASARQEAVVDFEGDLAELAPLATRDRSPEVRLAAVQRLADGETPVARAALRRALEDDDPDVLVEAIVAVTTQGDRKSVPALRRLRTHPDEEVRALAEDALFALAP